MTELEAYDIILYKYKNAGNAEIMDIIIDVMTEILCSVSATNVSTVRTYRWKTREGLNLLHSTIANNCKELQALDNISPSINILYIEAMHRYKILSRHNEFIKNDIDAFPKRCPWEVKDFITDGTKENIIKITNKLVKKLKTKGGQRV